MVKRGDIFVVFTLALVFLVLLLGFSAFSVAGSTDVSTATTYLAISDDTDTIITYNQTNVTFYANYSNVTDHSAIVGNCSIKFNIFGSWTELEEMWFNDTSQLFEFGENITKRGISTYNISCIDNTTEGGYDNLSLEDDINISNSPPSTPTELKPDVAGAIYSDQINITCNGSTDYENDSIMYTVLVNYSDNTYEVLTTSLTDSTKLVWDVSNYPSKTIVEMSCFANDTFDVSSSLVNSITFYISRTPYLIEDIPNQTWDEDVNQTINLTEYFNDTDGDDLNYSVVLAPENMTVHIDNDTNLMVLEPDANFYGVNNISVRAFDFSGANATSNNVTLTVIGRPEVAPVSPQDGASGNNPVTFVIRANDTYDITSCSLVLDGSLNQTVLNPNLGALDEIVEDGGGYDDDQLVSGHTLTKQFNVTQNILQIRVMAKKQTPIDSLNVSINNGEVNYTISSSAVSSSYGFVTVDVNPSDFNLNEDNNVSFTSSGALFGQYFYIAKNTTYTSLGNSYDDGNPISGELLIRLVNQTDLLAFDSVTLSPGAHQWNGECNNTENRSARGAANFTINMQNAAPTQPTSITASGDFDNSIDLECVGSTDADGQDLNYTFEYQRNAAGASWITIISAHSSSSYTWDVSTISNQEIYIRCKSYDGITYSGDRQSFPTTYTINHPNAPNWPTNLTCDDNKCADYVITGTAVQLNCSGASDTGSYNYIFKAYYENVSGSNWLTIGSVAASNDVGILSWDTSEIFNQTDVNLSCYADDGGPVASLEFSQGNLTIDHDAPEVPDYLVISSGVISDHNISINCSSTEDHVLYRIFANYDSNWHLINSSYNKSYAFNWNVTDLFSEQEVDVKCQATNGTFYSSFYNPSGEVVFDWVPSTPNNLTPAEGNYEYELNYSCSGSNNSNYFTYSIDYYNGNWIALTTDFPGIAPANDSTLWYEDGIYSEVTQYADDLAQNSPFYVNLTNSNYTLCTKAKATTTTGTPRYKLSWDCDDASLSNCQTESYITLTTTLTETCRDVELTKTGEKYFSIDRFGDGTSSNQITTQIDQVEITAKPFTWNTTLITPQNVDLRCKAADNAGSTSYYNPTTNITIDRLPVENNSIGTITGAENTNSTIELDDYFYDPDGTNLNYTIIGNDDFTYTINETTNNLTITPDTDWTGDDKFVIQMDDGLMQVDSSTVTYHIDTPQQQVTTGGNGPTTTIVPADGPAAPPDEPEEPPQPPSGDGEPEEPIEELPQEIEEPGILLFKHSRKVRYLLGGRTEVTETIESIAEFAQENVKVRLTVPKNIADTADDIEVTSNTPYIVVEYDPILEFGFDKFSKLDKKEIVYTLPGRYNENELEDVKLEIIAKRYTEEEIQAKIDQEKAMLEAVIVEVKEEVIEDTFVAEVTINVSKEKIATGTKATLTIAECALSEETPTLRAAMTKGIVICNQPVDFIDAYTGKSVRSWLMDVEVFKCKFTGVAGTRCPEGTSILTYKYEQDDLVDRAVNAGKLSFELFWFGIILILIFLLAWQPDPKKAKSKVTRWIFEKSKNAGTVLLVALFLVYIIAEFNLMPADLGFIKNVVSVLLFLALFYRTKMFWILTGTTKNPAGEPIKVKNILVNFLVVFAFFHLFIPSVVDQQAASLANMVLFKNTLLFLLQLPIVGILGMEGFIVTLGLILALVVFVLLYITYIKGQGTMTLFGIRKGIAPSGTENFILWFRRLLKRFRILIILLLFYMIFDVSIHQLAWTLDSAIAFILFGGALLFAVLKKQKGVFDIKKVVDIIWTSIKHAVGDVDVMFTKVMSYFRYARTISFPLLLASLLLLLKILLVYVVPYIFVFGRPTEYSAFLTAGSHLSLWQLIPQFSLSLDWVVATLIYFINAIGLVAFFTIPFFLAKHLLVNKWKHHTERNKFDLPAWVMAIVTLALVIFIFAPSFTFTWSDSALLPGLDIVSNRISGVFESNPLAILVSISVIVYILYTITRLAFHKVKAPKPMLDIFGIMFFVSPFVYYLTNAYVTTDYYSLSIMLSLAVLSAIGVYWLSAVKHFDYYMEWAAMIVLVAAIGFEVTDHFVKIKISMLSITTFAPELNFVTLTAVVFNLIKAVALPLFFAITILYGFVRELMIQEELGLHPHSRLVRALFLVPKPYKVSEDEEVRDTRKIKWWVAQELAKHRSAEKTIGGLLDCDVPLHTVKTVVETADIDYMKRETLLREVDSRYKEAVKFEVSAKKHPNKIARRLMGYELSEEEFDRYIDEAPVKTKTKDKIKTALSKLEKPVVKEKRREKLLVTKPTSLVELAAYYNIKPTQLKVALSLLNQCKDALVEDNATLALTCARKASVLNPKDEEPHQWISYIYETKRQWKRAINEINKAIKVYKFNPQSYFIRARLMINKGEFRKALKDLDRAERYGWSVKEVDKLRTSILKIKERAG